MSYILKPGIMQDHTGRRFQYGEYPSGKCIIVYLDPPRPVPHYETPVYRNQVLYQSKDCGKIWRKAKFK